MNDMQHTSTHARRESVGSEATLQGGNGDLNDSDWRFETEGLGPLTALHSHSFAFNSLHNAHGNDNGNGGGQDEESYCVHPLQVFPSQQSQLELELDLSKCGGEGGGGGYFYYSRSSSGVGTEDEGEVGLGEWKVYQFEQEIKAHRTILERLHGGHLNQGEEEKEDLYHHRNHHENNNSEDDAVDFNQIDHDHGVMELKDDDDDVDDFNKSVNTFHSYSSNSNSNFSSSPPTSSSSSSSSFSPPSSASFFNSQSQWKANSGGIQMGQLQPAFEPPLVAVPSKVKNFQPIFPVDGDTNDNDNNFVQLPPPVVEVFMPRKFTRHAKRGGERASSRHQCQYCNSSFTRHHDLVRHLRIHLGIRPYQCSNCSQAFTRSDSLARHRRISGCK